MVSGLQDINPKGSFENMNPKRARFNQMPEKKFKPVKRIRLRFAKGFIAGATAALLGTAIVSSTATALKKL